MRGPHFEPHLGQVGSLGGDEVEAATGEVSAEVELTMRGHAEKHETGATADLEHPPWRRPWNHLRRFGRSALEVLRGRRATGGGSGRGAREGRGFPTLSTARRSTSRALRPNPCNVPLRGRGCPGCQDGCHRLVKPLPHLRRRDGGAVGSALPAGDVEGGILFGGVGIVGVVEEQLPLLELGALEGLFPSGFGIESGRRLKALLLHQPGHQTRLAAGIGGAPPGPHHRPRHRRVLLQHALDLPRLDAEAPHLHLMVHPAEKLHLAATRAPRQVAGAVEPLAGDGGGGVGHEARGGEGVATPVAAGQPFATEVDLPRGAEHHRPQVTVEEMHGGVGQGPADVRRPVRVDFALDAVPGCKAGALGGAVEVHQPAVEGLAHGPHPAWDGGFGAEQQMLEPMEDLRRLLRRLMEGAHGQGEGGDTPLFEGRPEQAWGEEHVFRHVHQGGAGEQGAPEFEGRGIEGSIRHLGDAVPGPEPYVVGAEGQPADGVLHDRHALGAAGGTRGEHHVGQTVAVAGTGWSDLLRTGGRVGGVRGGILQTQDFQTSDLQGLRQGLISHQHPRCHVVEHGPQAAVRVGRVEGKVGAIGLQDAELGHRQRGPALHQYRHRLLVRHSQGAQAVGQAVAPAVELAVGDDVLGLTGTAADQGRGRGIAPHLLLEEIGQTGAARPRGGGIVPLPEQLMPRRYRQRAQLGEARRRPVSRGADQPAESVRETP